MAAVFFVVLFPEAECKRFIKIALVDPEEGL